MIRQRIRFAVATVVDVTGSSSAKPGAKALIDSKGKIIHGWVGGGCLARFVAQEAMEAIAAKQPRLIAGEFDDDAIGFSIPCGGITHVFIEPVLPRPTLIVVGHNKAASTIASLSKRLGFSVFTPRHADDQLRAEENRQPMMPIQGGYIVFTDPFDHPTTTSRLLSQVRPKHVAALIDDEIVVEESRRRMILVDRPIHTGLPLGATLASEKIIALLGEIMALEHGSDTQSMSRATQPRGNTSPSPHPPPQLWVIGSGKITDEFQHLARIIHWPVITIESCSKAIQAAASLSTNEPPIYALVAAQHKDEHLLARHLLERGAHYVALLASRKRAELTLDWLRITLPDPAALERLFSPAGLALGAKTPPEIALSVLCEMIAVHRGAMTGQTTITPKSQDAPSPACTQTKRTTTSCDKPSASCHAPS